MQVAQAENPVIATGGQEYVLSFRYTLSIMTNVVSSVMSNVLEISILKKITVLFLLTVTVGQLVYLMFVFHE